MFPRSTYSLPHLAGSVAVIFLALSAGVSRAQAAPESESKQRPNVILIVTDDQGYGDMACNGNPWLETPHLDRMHAESVRLDDYHVDPVCTPTRAALMTGRHSLRVGAWTVTEGRQLLDPDETTMAEVFRDGGYRTGMFGKWHLGDTFPYAPRFRGFDEVLCHRAGGVDEIGNPKGNDYFDDTYFRNGVAEKFEGYCTDVFFREMLRFIGEDNGGNGDPFFVYLPLNTMHGPFTVADAYADRFREMELPEERSKFYGMVENFDENLGMLFNALEQRQLSDNTLVIFMGDNGSAGGARVMERHTGFNAGMRGAKGDVYEGGHRVACFVRWPGQLEAGRSIDELTTHHDWLPTLIDLCDLPAPNGVRFDGRSLVPLLTEKASESDESPAWPERTVFIARHADQPQLWTPGTTKSRKSKYPRRAVLTERWRLVNDELYDIAKDPGQTRDLATKHPQVVATLDAAYREWWQDAMSHRANYTRFLIGAEQENPTAFTVRDWHPETGQVIWKKPQLAENDRFINGFWVLEVQRAGRYRVTLRRFPDDEPAAIGASVARVRIGEVENEISLQPTDVTAEFDLDLTAGTAELRTWLTDAKSGEERGAYFVAITRLDR